jgi:hypothetical protein
MTSNLHPFGISCPGCVAAMVEAEPGFYGDSISISFGPHHDQDCGFWQSPEETEKTDCRWRDLRHRAIYRRGPRQI